MAYELEQRGLNVERQKAIPLIYDEIHMQDGFRADLMVEGLVIIEIKAVEALAAVHYKQLLTYLKVADKRLGILINFDQEFIKDGIKRVANGL